MSYSFETLQDFVVNLLNDDAAKAAYDANPQAALSDAGLSDLTPADVQEVIPLVADGLPAESEFGELFADLQATSDGAAGHFGFIGDEFAGEGSAFVTEDEITASGYLDSESGYVAAGGKIDEEEAGGSIVGDTELSEFAVGAVGHPDSLDEGLVVFGAVESDEFHAGAAVLVDESGLDVDLASSAGDVSLDGEEGLDLDPHELDEVLDPDNLPDMDDLPGVDDLPHLPDLNDLPHVPEPGDTAQLPDLGGLPDLGDLGDVPGLDDLPQVPDLGDLPNLDVVGMSPVGGGADSALNPVTDLTDDLGLDLL